MPETVIAARAQDAGSALACYLGPRHPARGYTDLHEHVIALAEAGLLVVVGEPINKDTEIHPLVRWQYRGGIAEPDRKAFLFTCPTDARGSKFLGSVLVGGLAANREIYRRGIGKPLDNVGDAWLEAMVAPLKPRLVADAPCQEAVVLGAALDQPGGGLDALPVPVSTPGWDNGPFLSAGHFITRDPDTGIQNLGTYRGQIKARRRLGMNASLDFRPGIYRHWLKYKARGEPMPACVVVGCPPIVSYAAGQKMPEELDELEVAGALAGSPLNVVRARTVDLLVPAEAEFVIEGHIRTDMLEPEGPFGESHGYVNLQEYNAFMEVTAITHRRHPILTSIISQVTPSESSVMRRAAMEPGFLHHLRSVLGIGGVRRVWMHEPLTAVLVVMAIQFAPSTTRTEIWRALHGAANLHRFAGRWIIAIDEDIDPENLDALFWAMAYRCQPQHDVVVVPRKDPGHGPRYERDGGETAAVLVDATLKSKFPPVALPKREYMERARQLWERLGLPPLRPEPPWHGYCLGDWSESFERQAQMGVSGEYFAVGDQLAQMRRGDVAMNTPVARDDEDGT